MSDLKQKLTFVDLKVTDTFGSGPFLSEDGSKAYVTFAIDVIPNRVNVAAQWYVNNNGTLQVVDQVLEDNDPFNPIGVDNGEASKDFEYFSLLDEGSPDAITGQAPARLRIYNQFHSLIATRIFGAGIGDPFPYWGDFSFNGGAFSANNKYVAVSYVFSPPGSLIQNSVLRIIDITQPGLPDAFTPLAYQGNTGTNPRFVTLKRKCKKNTFVFLEVTGGIFNPDINAPASEPPFLLRVLKLPNSNAPLEQVLEKNFAKTFTTSFLQKSKEKVVVAIAVSKNVKPGELTEYIDRTDIIADNDYFRSLGIFEFDGHDLDLITKRFFRLGPSAIWHPSGNFLFSRVNPANASFVGPEDVVFRTNGPSTGFWLKLDCDKCNKLAIKNADADLIPVQIRSAASISGNGKWLLIASSDTPFPTLDCGAAGQILFNLVLYRIEIDC